MKDTDMNVVEMLVLAGCCQSRSIARRLIAQGAVEINGEKMEAAWQDMPEGTEWEIKVGEKTYNITEGE